MGSLISVAISRIKSKLSGKNGKIVIIGLDNAGKTTILHRINNEMDNQTKPTIAFNVESLTYKNINFQIWDLGGQTAVRPIWRYYFASCSAIIFVIDSADEERFDLVQSEIDLLKNENSLNNCLIAILANKQDLSNAYSLEQLMDKIHFNELNKHKWKLFSTSAKKNQGIENALDWIADNIA